jgi:tetratricopeptide (TPR) repeat protein
MTAGSHPTNFSSEPITPDRDWTPLRREPQKTVNLQLARQDDITRERASLRAAAAAVAVGNPISAFIAPSAIPDSDSPGFKDSKTLPIADRLLLNEYFLLRNVENSESLTEDIHVLVFPHKKPTDEEANAFCMVLAQRLLAQHEALVAADAKLRERNEDSFNRLLEEEHDAFTVGARASGRAQREGYKDALGLVQGITETPSGRRHFGAWFRQGWLLWKTEAPLEEVETAFYQAARLSSTDPNAAVYQNLAARHLAEIQMALGRYGDAYETMTAALAVFPEDPMMLHSSARAAARAGNARDAFRLTEQCITLQPLISTLLVDDPYLADQRSAAVDTLQKLRQVAHNRHATTTERWQKALDLVRRAESMADITLPVPETLTEGGAKVGSGEDDNRAALVLDSAEKSLDLSVKHAADLEFRQKRYIDKLFSDRASWQQSMEGLKNEAKAMNLNLSAPPPKKGLFGKKKEGHESVFLNYHTCRQTLVTIETEIRDNLTELKAKLAEATQRRELLENTLAWLRENGKPLR